MCPEIIAVLLHPELLRVHSDPHLCRQQVSRWGFLLQGQTPWVRQMRLPPRLAHKAAESRLLLVQTH